MVSEARCEVCGRPWDGGTLLPREIPCQGCHGEFEALKAAVDAKGVRLHTDDEAKQLATNAHRARETALGLNQRYLWLQRNAAGKHAITGAPLSLTGAELQAVKAKAAAKIAKLDAEAA